MRSYNRTNGWPVTEIADTCSAELEHSIRRFFRHVSLSMWSRNVLQHPSQSQSLLQHSMSPWLVDRVAKSSPKVRDDLRLRPHMALSTHAAAHDLSVAQCPDNPRKTPVAPCAVSTARVADVPIEASQSRNVEQSRIVAWTLASKAPLGISDQSDSICPRPPHHHSSGAFRVSGRPTPGEGVDQESHPKLH